MSVTIEWADWISPENGSTVRIRAVDYNKDNMGGTLICPHPGCTCELKHIPEHEGLGSVTISPHFARKGKDQQHNRAIGCDFPNTSQDKDAKKRAGKANKIITFFEGKGQKYIYLNRGFEKQEFSFPRGLMETQWRYVNNHRTAKQSDYDVSISVKNARDWEKLRHHKSFRDKFYDNAFVVANGYTIPFRHFESLSYARLIKLADHTAKKHFNRAVLTEVTPLPAKTGTNFEEGIYFIKCKPETVPSGPDHFPINVQPVIATRSSELVEEFNKRGDDQRFLLWASSARVDPENTQKAAELIRQGQVENSLPVTLWVYDKKQIHHLPS